MDLNLLYDSTTQTAPAGFTTSLNAAAAYLDSLIHDQITVNITVSYGTLNGTTIPAGGAYGGEYAYLVNYGSLASALSNVQSLDGGSIATALPATNPSGGQRVAVSGAEGKALGLLAANATAADGYVAFSDNPQANYATTDTAVAGKYDFFGQALHELTHALGRISFLGGTVGVPPSLLDLYRYASPGVLQTTPWAPAYFSLDQGTTNLDQFATTGDASDWSGGAGSDAFNAYGTYGAAEPLSTIDQLELSALGFSLACFAAGTHIRTPRGEVAVEALRAGRDSIVTANGMLAPVRWIGSRRIRPARLPRPEEAMPVRVLAGALGPGVPRRDLFLSPDHALFLGGVLIPVRYLVNGRTIAPVARASVTYFHVELDRHDILLAEGAPAESYLDTGNRAAFTGGGAWVVRPGHAEHVWATRACAKLVCRGPRLVAARRALLRQAAALGHRVTGDPALVLLADGVRLAPVMARSRRVAALPPGTREVRLRSRRHVPAHVCPGSDDTRHLGIAVGQLLLDGREVALDSPALRQGWHQPEGAWRWTDGDAVMDVAGTRHLTFTLAITGRYWQSPPP